MANDVLVIRQLNHTNIMEKPKKENRLIDVLWVKAHIEYAYSIGQEGQVFESELDTLVKEGYVTVITK